MRLLLDSYTADLSPRGKFSRVLAEISTNPGGCDCLFVTAIGDTLFERDANPLKNQTYFSKLDVMQRLLKMAYLHARYRSPRELPDAIAMDITWTLAKYGAHFPLIVRRRLERMIDLDTHFARRCFFEFWKHEGEVTEIKAHTRELMSFEPGDTLLLTGASWANVNPLALAQKYSAQGLVIVYFIYDFLPFDIPSIMRVGDFVRFQQFLFDMGATANLIVAADAEVARRLGGFLSERGVDPMGRIVTQSMRGAALKRRAVAPSPRLRELGLCDAPFMLSVSTLAPRKNQIWLYVLCEKLRRKRQDTPLLVIAGSMGNHVTQARALQSDPGWGTTGVFIPDPSDDELAWLLSRARLFLDPSFGGGLGLSLTEAVNFGLPCIAADAPSLIEAADGGAVHLPRDETAWMDGIIAVLEGETPSLSPTPVNAEISTTLRNTLAARRVRAVNK